MDDSRGATNRNDVLSGGTTLQFNVGNGTQSGDSTHGQGGEGQFALANFTADSSGIATFNVSTTAAGGVIQANAFQIRQLSAPVPEASSSVGLGILLALGALVVVARRKSVKA